MQNQTESGPKCLGGEAVVMWLMTVPASACSRGGCGDGEGGGVYIITAPKRSTSFDFAFTSNETLKWLSLPHILMRNSGGDSY